jgi:hypothetical protein
MQERHHVFGLRIAPEHRLGEDAVARDVNIEDAVCACNHLYCRDGRFELLENSRCQTDSVRPRASGYAVLDTNGGPIGHGTSLSADNGRSPDPQSTPHVRNDEAAAVSYKACIPLMCPLSCVAA